MQTFVTQQWKQSKEKSSCLHGKKLSEKKVKSPLHLFSTLRRSPSYPPPGCGKSKSKLKSEQDGISKTHKLLRRTCSSTVKADDVCAKSHRTFGRSLSSDPRAEQAMSTIKSHKLLGRPCPTAGKQEDCLTLKSHKLLTRSCSGDPRCEHNTNLKPHKLLSRSYSSNLRMEELYGLKNHKLLSKSYSGAPKSSKNEHFKEPNAEGRRLSLTSGLIGILTPSSSSSQPPTNGAKCIPIRDRGFLVQTIEFAEQRIPVLNEYCVVCDEPHVFQNGPMLRPTVCERELCVFAFQTLGVMNEAADEIATGAQVVDLLVSMCRSALESPRKVVIFEPYPSVVDPNDPQMLAFNPRKKNYDRVMKALDSITSIREMTQQLKFMHTPHQFLLLSSPPAKESNFRAAKKLFGSTFAFHGSHIENWHSILRNGLVVASNTRLQLHGAMYGSGIYLSPMSSISFGYSGMNKKQKVSTKDEPASSSKNSNASQTPVEQTLRSTIDKWEFLKLRSFCKAKETVSKTKQQLTDWEKIFTNPTFDRGLISKIYKELKKLVSKTPNIPIKKWGTELNRQFSIEESKMAERHIRKCSTSLAVREMQIKTTLRYHLTPVRMAKIKNTNDSSCWRGCGERGTLLHCWWECQLVQPLWKSVWRLLKKMGMSLPQDPAIPLLGIYPKKAHSYNKDICSTMFTAALFVIARNWKQPRCPSNEE
ncbi:Poly [ADP-ribose] polymerase 8 [Cricetulus griseus]|uniref:Poly [ADP-ribose] polymerase n=1 Tax=Cricetulus griseus TaxID=10029 RepID=G3H209_CRIGR|nr:Poly [ADP-ribose] polymerase 8 [Cricetulus griseus]